ncbi:MULTISPECIES: hypothetical protein [unclassified Janthinobacterium]|uniref:hypothetical protein n=1 Tax=unclassified Janthinobacterium TaxID=2610881 RepID=UPI001620C007|nr:MULTISPECIES: hypothetical protein [unclassified Janthinobacterium]MBB5369483.1 hypothetical protein [Janthinobacterium sp. K2C7]MBB5382561.1 hypothetical protein [Janthinobacterium sp. K2Li3]MBB5388138.1 hypothetical protein [Janthinobacterium sp. K2E3]
MQACLVRPLALFVLSATLVSASAVADDVTATAAERASLLQFYGQQYPDQPAARTVFQSVPVVGGHGRELVGSVETAPYRGHGALCRTQRTKFVLQGTGKQERWQEAGIEYYAWLDRGTCRPVAEPVRLLQRVPDTELEGVLLYQKPLLERARLLMAGNTACAPLRSLKFSLAAVDVGASVRQEEERYALVFKSDRDSYARVWLRKSAGQYDAWNVTCPPML